MANPHKGEVSFESGGATYTVVFNVNVLVEIDEELGEGFVEKVVAKGEATRKQLRQMFWIALRQRHPEIDDAKKAGALVGNAQMSELLTRAMMLSQPEAARGDAQNPPKPGELNGQTGPASSGDGAASASTLTPSG